MRWSSSNYNILCLSLTAYKYTINTSFVDKMFNNVYNLIVVVKSCDCKKAISSFTTGLVESMYYRQGEDTDRCTLGVLVTQSRAQEGAC